jgi:hypothetical protein
VTQSAPATAVYPATFNVAATGGASGQPVVIAASGACSGGGNDSATITMTSGTGTCTVTYNQAGDTNYSAATQVTETTAAQPASQTINVTQNAPASAVYNSTFNVAATGGASGNSVVIAGSGSCSGSGNNSATITMTSGSGTCTVTYNQAGNANYSAAAQVTQTTAAQKAGQTINVTQHAPATAMNGSTFNVAATGGTSGNAVAIAGSGACSGGGNNSATITMTSGSGTCTATYNQAGNANYSAAPQVTEPTTPQHYSFTGFYAPIDNLPTVNNANAGSAIPVKWTLTLNGVPISNPASFVGLTSNSVNCNDFAASLSAPVEEYAPGTSGLQYQGNGNWQFNWQTSKSWAKTCRTIVLTLKDGNQHTAKFKFTK